MSYAGANGRRVDVQGEEAASPLAVKRNQWKRLIVLQTLRSTATRILYRSR